MLSETEATGVGFQVSGVPAWSGTGLKNSQFDQKKKPVNID
jgi:hypothetical protein